MEAGGTIYEQCESTDEADYRNADDDSGTGVVCHYFIGKHETAAE
jgi:hypothetical protein